MDGDKQTLEKDVSLSNKKNHKKRHLSSIVGLWSLFMPLVQGRELHEGLTHKRDWSKVSHQFNLGKHMMAPTSRDRRDGIENSRRLARNAVKLGIDNETHRKLIAANPPTDIVQSFDDGLLLPSDGNRVQVNGTSDALPFGDGPGVFPPFPQGTNAFWDGTGKPEKMWETVACPVADVEGFLENPLSCVFGYNDDDEVTGNLMDTFSSLNGTAILTAMTDSIVPLAVEFVYNVSGLSWLELILTNVCSILGIVDSIISVVESLGDIGSSIGDALNPANWFRERHLGEEFDGCIGHLTTCNGDDAVCSGCFTTAGETCSEDCRTCFQPLTKPVPDMDGLCIETAKLRDFITAPAPPLIPLQSYYSALNSNYIKKVVSDEVLAAIEAAKVNINSNVDSAETSINTNVDSAETSIKEKVEDTCAAPPPAPSRRLGHASEPSDENQKHTIDDFMQSEEAREAKIHASNQGLKDKDADKVFSKLFESLSESGDSFNGKLEEQIKNDFSDPKKLELVERMANAEVENNVDKYTGILISEILEGSISKQTRRLDADALRDTISKLEDIKKGRTLHRGNRQLDSDLEGGCLDLIDTIKTFIKDTVLTPLLTELVEGIASALGEDSVFSTVKDNEIYKATLDAVPNLSSSPLLMSFGFVSVFDPWGGVLKVVMSALVDISQTIVGFFLYGCDVFDDTCAGDLPSVRNEVLPIKERRDGNIYMAAGCDSEFEGELAFYKPAFVIVEKLLDAAGKSVIEFFNIPINIVKLLLQAVTLLFSQMNDVCSYLDGYVQLSFVEATFENSRFALQELACRNPFQIGLQQGYGCDGIDNDCDDDKQIDECGEDIFPPAIDAADAVSLCANKIFSTPQAAVECFNAAGLISAKDDCKEVVLTVEDKDDAAACSAVVEIKAVAQGCGGRDPEDTTVLNVAVDVDNDPPEVSCALETQGLKGNGAGVFTDLKFNFTAVDGGEKCTGTKDLAVTIEVLSNEVIATGGGEMVFISDSLTDGVPSIWAQDLTCKTDQNGKCKISSPRKSRKYIVRVTATDKAGNVGMEECNTIVGNADVDGSDPLFLIGKVDIIGGVEIPTDEPSQYHYQQPHHHQPAN